MRTSDKIFILLFCIVLSPILALFATAVDSRIYKPLSVSNSLNQDLSWFSQNPSISIAIVTICYVSAGILLLLAIVALISIATDHKSSNDHDFIKDIIQTPR